MTLRIISYGGGVQSTALCVLATQGKIGHVDAAIFANVGDDSEHPATLGFVRDVMQPWAAERGLPIIEVRRTKPNGEPYPSIFETQTRAGSRRVIIPAFMSGGVPTSRVCTSDWKIGVVRKWCRENGATKDSPADVLIGISVDEIERANGRSGHASQRVVYPLLDLAMNRAACEAAISAAGIPVPPKSSCFFCPYHSRLTWAEMRRDDPDLFDRSQQLEDATNERRAERGLTPVYLTRFGKRLSDAIDTAQDTLFTNDAFNEGKCDEGYCWT